jgi:streptogramin lyase
MGQPAYDLANERGIVTTIAGPSFLLTTGPGTAASFRGPSGVAVDGAGNVYVADQFNNMIRKISPSGAVRTLAGTGAYGSVNGSGATASFSEPTGVALDVKGNLYVADFGNNLIRKIDTSGSVSTLAGSGTPASTDGQGVGASFDAPAGVAVDAAGNVYVADEYNNQIRKISPTGFVSTLAGNGNTGSSNGAGTAASFYYPTGVAVDVAGNVYVADWNNNMVRMIDPLGVVTTLAGNGIAGYPNGPVPGANLDYPYGIAIDATGNLYVGSEGLNLIEKISPSGVVVTLAGKEGDIGDANGTVSEASFFSPLGVAVDAAENVYVADYGNNLIRKISPSGDVSTLAGSGAYGSTNSTATASFNSPNGVAVDDIGDIYVADYFNNVIRAISPSGVVGTMAGTGSVGAANGIDLLATFNYPYGVAVDGSGNIYVADVHNNMIRKITSFGEVGTLAGSGKEGHANGTGTAASFFSPQGVAVDAAGNVYVADQGNNLIRKITSSGAVTTLAGSGASGSVNGMGTAASFFGPTGLAVDAAGNVYVADQLNNMIRKINSSGVVSTLAGSGTSGSSDGTGTGASFYQPSGVCVDASGNIYVADQFNNVIRKIIPSGLVVTWAGNGTIGSSNGTGYTASFNRPTGVAVDAVGNVYVADAGNNLIRKITTP